MAVGALGGIGAVVGAVGGIIQARQAAKEASRARREVRRFGRMGRRMFERERERFLGLETSQLGLQFLKESLTDPLGGSFGREFTDRFRAAQAVRGFGGGLGGGSGGAQEATFLARIADQRRRELLPVLNLFELQAQQVGQAAFERGFAPASIIAGLPRATQSPIGAGLAGALQGGFGGALLGAQLQGTGGAPLTGAEQLSLSLAARTPNAGPVRTGTLAGGGQFSSFGFQGQGPF